MSDLDELDEFLPPNVFDTLKRRKKPRTKMEILAKFRRTMAEKTHCQKGHLYTPESTIWWKNHRQCKICANASRRNKRKTA